MVVVCIAVILIIVIVLIHRTRKIHFNNFVAELKNRNLPETNKSSASKSIGIILYDCKACCFYCTDNERVDLMNIIPSYLAVPIDELKVLDISIGKGNSNV